MSVVDRHPLYFLRGREDWRDPWPAYARLRDEAPLHRATHDDGSDYYVLSRFVDIFDAARDTGTFSSAKGLTLEQDAMAMFEDQAAPIVMMDPPDHTTMRRLVSRPMTRGESCRSRTRSVISSTNAWISL